MDSKMIKITIEPFEYDVRPSMPKDGNPVPSDGSLQEFHVDTTSSIFPKFPETPSKGRGFIYTPEVNLSLPDKVKIELTSENIKDFKWRNVPIPVMICTVFSNSMQEKGIYMFFSEKNGEKNILTIPVFPHSWSESITPKLENEPHNSMYYRDDITEGVGTSDYWNMTYFIHDLPKYSVTYDFWVTVRGVESVKKQFAVEFYVDGEKVKPENFKDMSAKYPALKNDTEK